MSDCECAKRLKEIEERLANLEGQRNERDLAGTTSSSTSICYRGRTFGFVRNDLRQRPLDAQA